MTVDGSGGRDWAPRVNGGILPLGGSTMMEVRGEGLSDHSSQCTGVRSSSRASAPLRGELLPVQALQALYLGAEAFGIHER